MQDSFSPTRDNRSRLRGQSRDSSTPRIALDEYELAARWGLSVKTLRRWRQEHLGPVFCKLGARVTYLISEVEAFERRVSRFSTSTRAYA
ncbi:helix-turn-helix transcriptional regulator [Burkholderia pseudomallei]|uniref:helix-turn-helix transcriptional regulator n=1 Tax=Burkholderia pseudomallei TaxID=28450 RepID=UPI0018C5C00F|nr:DNA-binding protein [Burkholderia pseudomallei]MBG1252171.1 helix-turn-helix domain-containing protein [Burkholderia pseudomallei]